MESIRVNGVEIAEAAVAREVQYHPAESLEQARLCAAEALVVRELLLQRAFALGLLSDRGEGDGEGDREEDTIQLLLSQEISVPEADEETCRRYWTNNRGRFRSPDLVEAAHILLPAAPDDAEGRARAKRLAVELIGVLQGNPGRFASLAVEHSACPSRDQGGSLGQVTRGETVSDLETFLFNLDPGQLCPIPVETRYGFHVVRVDHRVEGKELPLESVRGKIAEFLRDRSWQQAVRQYIGLLIGEARIEGIDLQGATSPLVQ